MRRLIALILVLSIFVFGCGKKTSSDSAKSTIEKLSKTAPVLARVNNWTIGADEFKVYLKGASESAAAQNIDINSYEIKKTVLEQLVRQEVLFQIGIMSGLSDDPVLLKVPPEARKTLIAQTMMRSIQNNIEVTEKEIQEFYKKNKATLKLPLEEVKEDIRGMLNRIKAEEAIIQLMDQLKDQIKVVIDYEKLKALS